MEKRVKRIVYRSLRKLGVKRENIWLDAELGGNLGFDEIDITCLVFLVENQIGFYLDDTKIQHIITIRDLVKMIVIEFAESEPITSKS